MNKKKKKEIEKIETTTPDEICTLIILQIIQYIMISNANHFITITFHIIHFKQNMMRTYFNQGSQRRRYDTQFFLPNRNIQDRKKKEKQTKKAIPLILPKEKGFKIRVASMKKKIP